MVNDEKDVIRSKRERLTECKKENFWFSGEEIFWKWSTTRESPHF
jgi:hypothetical protein